MTDAANEKYDFILVSISVFVKNNYNPKKCQKKFSK